MSLLHLSTYWVLNFLGTANCLVVKKICSSLLVDRYSQPMSSSRRVEDMVRFKLAGTNLLDRVAVHKTLCLLTATSLAAAPISRIPKNGALETNCTKPVYLSTIMERSFPPACTCKLVAYLHCDAEDLLSIGTETVILSSLAGTLSSGKTSI